MTPDPTDRILRLLTSVTETDGLRGNLDLPLYDEGVLDSMKTVELIVELEQAFGIEIPPSEFERAAWATPAKLILDIQLRIGT